MRNYQVEVQFKNGPAYEMTSGEPSEAHAKIDAVRDAKRNGFMGQVKKIVARKIT